MCTDRIAVCSWSLRPDDPSHLAALLREVDVPSVQLALNPLVDEPAVWRSVAGVLDRAGVRIISGMMATEGEDYSTLESIASTGGLRPDGTWPGNLARAERTAEVAADLGLDLVTFHAGFIPESADDPESDALRERLLRVDEIFARRGVNLALETGQETAPALRAMLEFLDRPSLGVNFDPANMILYGRGNPVEGLAVLGPWVRQIHVKDAMPTDVPGTWGTEVPVGEGAVDWPAFFGIATAIDPPVRFVIERESGEGRLPEVRQACEVIRRSLEVNG